ncbi:OB-fold-like protein [Raphanus sativus]|nr:OB-fold-like protein [Raphanus sativus]
MEMVLADSKGDMIHGTVRKELVSQFVTKIIQGETKLMVIFTVTMASGSYRTTNHPYRIVFLPTTRLRTCDALPSNLTGLDPVKYESIEDGSLNTGYLVVERPLTPNCSTMSPPPDFKSFVVFFVHPFQSGTLFRLCHPSTSDIVKFAAAISFISVIKIWP